MMTRILGFGLFLYVHIGLTTGVPHLQAIPNLSIYAPSDDITLLCCPQDHSSHHIFELYKEDSMIHSTEQDKGCATYKFNIRTQQDIGPYYCAYKALENGTYVHSNKSEPIIFQFADTPLPPAIMLEPSFSVYTTKESMHLVCEPPDGTTAKAIEIYREEKKIHEEKAPKSDYVISASAKDAPGKYHCKYRVDMNGRSLSSSPSEQVTVNITNVPPAPSLSLSSKYSVYIKEELVNLTCSFPAGFTVTKVQFYRNREPLPVTNTQETNTLLTFSLDSITTVNFTCKYYAEMSGRTIDSESSNEVTIITTEPPPAPSITLEPSQPVYITGDEVSIVCSVPHHLKSNLKLIKFYRSGLNIPTCENKPKCTVTRSTTQHNGNYSCVYSIFKHGRELSALSQSVPVTFTDIPQAPCVILTPKEHVYLKEENVSITCSIPEELTAISIQYFKNNQKIQPPKKMSTFVITNLSLEDTGRYTCQYSLNYSGRHISSLKSPPISITVEEVPPSPVIDMTPVLPMYIRGEYISIKCEPPTNFNVVHIQYFKDGKKFHTSSHNRYNISTLSLGNKGHYSCDYICKQYERQLLSKRSQSVSITIVDIPQAPSIILDPKLPLYIKGETVNITCSLPEESTAISIKYIKDDREIHNSETPQRMSSYIVSNMSLENAGNYKCHYGLNISGRHISSHTSSSVSIIVEDPLITPILKKAPDLQIYTVGENLVLTCQGFASESYKIYKDGQLLQNDFSHIIPKLQLNNNGNYTCTYNFNKKGRHLESSRSQSVNIYVIDPLPAPKLTLGGPIKKLEDGFQVILNCSAPDDNLLRTFYYFNTAEKNDVTNVTAFSASLELKLGPISQLSYSCEYEEELRGRKIRSGRSEILSEQLTEASMMSPPVMAGIIGVICLILCFTLALWFYKKSKKYSRHNRFSFSWYWKENRYPKKSYSSRPLNPEEKNKETNQVMDMTEDQCKIVSRQPSSLSITTEKEADPVDNVMNFSTFYSKNVCEGESALNSSIL
ncbi:platelet endothelial cell adhesion molecule-like [Anomaloglossus baeobatrachus]|uniref:platelet endothelial cell adhesion molecule-like n=1 Tax=Anomaloglossus baeobatrachus TaxID=238106 RepID=UPI003F4FB427